MQSLKRVEQDILVRGRVDSDHLEELRLAAYAEGTVSRPSADVLVGLHKRVQHPNPAFEKFFYQAIKDHILADHRINSEEARWLRNVVIADGAIKDESRKFLHELKGEAKSTCPEFEDLVMEAMKLPPERRTSGSGG